MATDLNIRILTDIRDSVQEIGKIQKAATKSFKTVDKGAKKAGSSVATFGAAVVVANQALELAAKALRAVSAGLDELKAFAKRGDEIAKTADKLGIAIESLQELGFVAERSGVSTESFNIAFQRLTRRAAEAAAGTGEAKDALKQLGIQLRDSQGRVRNTEDIFGDLADSFQRVPTQSEKVRLAFKLFDTEGVALVNVLNQGREGIDQLRDRFRQLGGVISTDAARASERFVDAQTDLNVALRGVGQVIATDILPALTRSARAITAFVVKNRQLISTIVIGLVRGAFFLLTKSLDVAIRGFFFFSNALTKVQRAINNVVKTVIQAQLAINKFLGRFKVLRGILEPVNNQLKESVKTTEVLDAVYSTALEQNIVLEKELLDLINGRTEATESSTKAIADQGNAAEIAAQKFKNLGEAVGLQDAAAQGFSAGVQGFAQGVAQGGEQGALSFLQAATQQINLLIPGLGALAATFLGLLAQGPEKVKEFVRGFVEALPELLDKIIESIPVLIAEIAKAIPKIISSLLIALAKLPFIFIKTLLPQIPKIVEAFAVEFLKIPAKFVEALIDALFGAIGGIGDFFGNLLGFAEGGEIPNLQQFNNDRGLVRAQGGEAILSRSLTSDLKDFLNESRQGGGGGESQVTIQIGEQELASVMLNLNRNGFRTS